ncbi:L-asparaginase 1 [Buchnera aphidicola (Aphis nasturtii)]|uniref:asparaginase n=1 Tax=Buchnera aphidicola TaxID=9 RepID=UPI0010C37AFE|nr:asparaginase [Buchnera aphidicola]QCI18494.1 L-asparaginase 1 [Buchnera aphidicola (Aphis nasturtii)]
MKKKNIYIAYTGGTIGMQKSNNGYIPIAGCFKKQLIKMPEFYSPEIPNFVIKEYNPLIDSSNMSPVEWQKIADDIKKKYYKYDGFIVLHGTDTMAYTASALSFILENLEKPIIITGSQIPIAAIRSDGRQNLLNSLLIIANYPINEVTLFFNHKLYRGNRATKSNADGFNAFSSPNIAPLLEVGINVRYLYKDKFLKKQKKLKVYKIIPQPISIITIYPGLSSKILKNFLLYPVKALILCTYGVGNAPQNKDFLNELYIADKKNIIIINLTQCASGKVNMNGYATGNSLKKVGVISGYDLTVEAALTKLHFLLSQNIPIKKIRMQMQNNLRGELTNHSYLL